MAGRAARRQPPGRGPGGCRRLRPSAAESGQRPRRRSAARRLAGQRGRRRARRLGLVPDLGRQGEARPLGTHGRRGACRRPGGPRRRAGSADGASRGGRRDADRGTALGGAGGLAQAGAASAARVEGDARGTPRAPRGTGVPARRGSQGVRGRPARRRQPAGDRRELDRRRAARRPRGRAGVSAGRPLGAAHAHRPGSRPDPVAGAGRSGRGARVRQRRRVDARGERRRADHRLRERGGVAPRRPGTGGTEPVQRNQRPAASRREPRAAA